MLYYLPNFYYGFHLYFSCSCILYLCFSCLCFYKLAMSSSEKYHLKIKLLLLFPDSIMLNLMLETVMVAFMPFSEREIPML